MLIEQEYKYKGPDGELLSGTLNLEFREIDRCRRSDNKLFFSALSLLAVGEDGKSTFSPSTIEKLGTTFIEELVIHDEKFDKTAFELLKSDIIAVFKLNMELFDKIIAPFLMANL